MFLLAVFLVGVLSGATASVLGFGIGSMLTPLLSPTLGASVAVAAVSIPHAAATGFRRWRLRHRVVRDVLVRFGLLSAAGGLAGAVLYTRLGGIRSAALTSFGLAPLEFVAAATVTACSSVCRRRCSRDWWLGASVCWGCA